MSQSANQMLAIPESPSSEYSPSDARLDYFKSLTTSQTLDRRAKNKVQQQGTSSPKTASPRMVRPSINRSNPEVREPVARAKSKKPRAFSKIAILSSFFEQKIAALANSGSASKGRSWKFPGLKKKKERYEVGMECCVLTVSTHSPSTCILVGVDWLPKSQFGAVC